jgi:hypothetical protein
MTDLLTQPTTDKEEEEEGGNRLTKPGCKMALLCIFMLRTAENIGLEKDEDGKLVNRRLHEMFRVGVVAALLPLVHEVEKLFDEAYAGLQLDPAWPQLSAFAAQSSSGRVYQEGFVNEHCGWWCRAGMASTLWLSPVLLP